MVDSIVPVTTSAVAKIRPLKSDEEKQPKERKQPDDNPSDEDDVEKNRKGVNLDEHC